MEQCDEVVPNEIRKIAKEVIADLLPNKSRDVYEKSYDKLMEWKKTKKIAPNVFSEEVMLTYFNELSSKYYC